MSAGETSDCANPLLRTPFAQHRLGCEALSGFSSRPPAEVRLLGAPPLTMTCSASRCSSSDSSPFLRRCGSGPSLFICVSLTLCRGQGPSLFVASPLQRISLFFPFFFRLFVQGKTMPSTQQRLLFFTRTRRRGFGFQLSSQTLPLDFLLAPFSSSREWSSLLLWPLHPRRGR